MIKVINKIPQIDSITLEEKKDFYLLNISYTPRYGFGMVNNGSANCPNDGKYDFINIGDIEAWENCEIHKPITEIQLTFPERTYDMFMQRDKETETFLFCKKSFFSNMKELVSLNYRD